MENSEILSIYILLIFICLSIIIYLLYSNYEIDINKDKNK